MKKITKMIIGFIALIVLACAGVMWGQRSMPQANTVTKTVESAMVFTVEKGNHNDAILGTFYVSSSGVKELQGMTEMQTTRLFRDEKKFGITGIADYQAIQEFIGESEVGGERFKLTRSDEFWSDNYSYGDKVLFTRKERETWSSPKNRVHFRIDHFSPLTNLAYTSAGDQDGMFSINITTGEVKPVFQNIWKTYMRNPVFTNDGYMYYFGTRSVQKDIAHGETHNLWRINITQPESQPELLYEAPPGYQIIPRGSESGIMKISQTSAPAGVFGTLAVRSAVTHQFPWNRGEAVCVTRDGKSGATGVVGSNVTCLNLDGHSGEHAYDFDIDQGRNASVNLPVRASAGGKVVELENLNSTVSYGNYIRIEHTDGRVSRYAHLYSICVNVGDNVAQGDIIGLEGNTGASSGDHLHYEIEVAEGNTANLQATFAECGCEPHRGYSYTSQNVNGANRCAAPYSCNSDSWNGLSTAKNLNIGSGGSTRISDCLSGSDKSDWFMVKPTDRTKFGRLTGTARFTDVRLGATAEVTLRNKSGNVLAIGRSDGLGGIVVSYCTQATRSFSLCAQCDRMYVVIQYNSGSSFLGM